MSEALCRTRRLVENSGIAARDQAWASRAAFNRAKSSPAWCDERVNGEFYVAPVYNRLVAQGRRIETFDVGAEGGGMYGLGTPADLRRFLELPLSHAASGVVARQLAAA